MSLGIAVVDSGYPCVPRLDTCRTVAVSTDEINLTSVDYRCPQGHNFTLEFVSQTSIPPIWECEVCETISIRQEN